MQIFIGALPRFTDGNGDAVVSGKLYIGQPNQDARTNPLTIYSDAALTNVLPNPIDLDAQGKPTHQIFLDGAHSYEVRTVNDVFVESSPYALGIGAGDSDGSATPIQDRFYIRPLNGNVIKNGEGLLGFEARRLTSSGDFLITTGVPRLYIGSTLLTEANGYQTGSDGFRAFLDASNINLQATIELKDSATGTPRDTSSAVDVLDGVGSDAIAPVIEASNGLAFTQAIDAGAWSPATSTVLTGRFYRGGSEIASAAVTFTLNTSTGILSGSVTTSNPDISVTFVNNATTAPTVRFDYSKDGDTSTIAESLHTARSGNTGPQGPAGASSEFFQLVAPLGRELKNGQNANGDDLLEIQIWRYVGGTATQVTSGDVRVFNNAGADLGYNPTFTSADISNVLLLFARRGAAQPVLDTTQLLDVTDGVGSNATFGSISPSNGLTSTRDKDLVWTPVANTTDLTARFYQGGAQIASETVRITRDNSTGNLSASTVVDDAGVTYTVINGGTRALTIEFTHTASGSKVSERVNVSLDGADGDTGPQGPEGGQGEQGPQGPSGTLLFNPISAQGDTFAQATHVGNGGPGQITYSASASGSTGSEPPDNLVISLRQDGVATFTHTVTVEKTFDAELSAWIWGWVLPTQVEIAGDGDPDLPMDASIVYRLDGTALAGRNAGTFKFQIIQQGVS